MLISLRGLDVNLAFAHGVGDALTEKSPSSPTTEKQFTVCEISTPNPIGNLLEKFINGIIGIPATAQSEQLVLARGVAYCSPNDQFSRREGRKVALAKALKQIPQLSKKDRADIWNAYFAKTNYYAHA